MSQPQRLTAAQRQAEAIADVERVSRVFHETYERLAPAHSYETRRASAVDWERVPPRNAALMRAVVTELLHTDVIRIGTRPQLAPTIPGQTTIEDHLPSHNSREALDDVRIKAGRDDR